MVGLEDHIAMPLVFINVFSSWVKRFAWDLHGECGKESWLLQLKATIPPGLSVGTSNVDLGMAIGFYLCLWGTCLIHRMEKVRPPDI